MAILYKVHGWTKKKLCCFWQVQEEASKEVVKAEEPLPENMGNKNFHVK